MLKERENAPPPNFNMGPLPSERDSHARCAPPLRSPKRERREGSCSRRPSAYPAQPLVGHRIAALPHPRWLTRSRRAPLGPQPRAPFSPSRTACPSTRYRRTTPAAISMRLAAVGCAKELFTSDAIAMLHEAAPGSLRDVDRIARNALRLARKKRKLAEAISSRPCSRPTACVEGTHDQRQALPSRAP